MNILIIGRGWVGKKVSRELLNRGHFVTLQSHEYHISKEYDYVVNCAGYTGKPNVDACELDKKNTIEGNSCFPILLYEKCKNLDIPLAHFSSGCIYQGNINNINDDPNYFGSIYSISKAVSDCYLKDKCLVFRIRMPFTEDYEDKNLLVKLIKYAKNGKLYDGGLNSLTDLDEAIIIACNLIEQNTIGPFNLVNSGSVSNRDIIKMMGIECEWFGGEEEFKKYTLASRSNCTIPCNVNMTHINVALEKRITNLLKKLS